MLLSPPLVCRSQCLSDSITVVRPAWAKMADGTSVSMKPKSPIAQRKGEPHPQAHHPDFAYYKKRTSILEDTVKMPPHLLVWNHPDYNLLMEYPYFRVQPDYKAYIDTRETADDLSMLNKAGKSAIGRKLIDTSSKAKIRMLQREVSAFHRISVRSRVDLSAVETRVLSYDVAADGAAGKSVVRARGETDEVDRASQEDAPRGSEHGNGRRLLRDRVTMWRRAVKVKPWRKGGKAGKGRLQAHVLREAHVTSAPRM